MSKPQVVEMVELDDLKIQRDALDCRIKKLNRRAEIDKLFDSRHVTCKVTVKANMLQPKVFDFNRRGEVLQIKEVIIKKLEESGE